MMGGPPSPPRSVKVYVRVNLNLLVLLQYGTVLFPPWCGVAKPRGAAAYRMLALRVQQYTNMLYILTNTSSTCRG